MDLDPPDVGELNRRAETWLACYVHAVVHRTTKVRPEERFRIEQPLLTRVPPRRGFETARREPRRVGRVPMIEWDAVFYSAPPAVVGQMIEARQPVASSVLELRFAGRLVATHQIVAAGSEPQWLPEHRAEAAEAIALGRHDRHLHPVAEPADRAVMVGSISAPATTTSTNPTSTCSRRSARTLTSTWVWTTRPTATGATVSRDAAAWGACDERHHDDRSDQRRPRLPETAPLRRRSSLRSLTMAPTAMTDSSLAALVAEEATATRQRRLNARLRFAHFPTRRTIEEFDFDFQPSIDPTLIADLAGLDFVEAGAPILLLGKPGCGKSHLAIALGIRAVEAGYRGYFTTATDWSP